MSSPTRFRFTNTLIRTLPPHPADSRSTDCEYSDTEASGLKCLVGKNQGSRRFLFRYLYHGRKRAIALGHWPDIDVSTARKIVAEHKRLLATGGDPKASKDAARHELTLDKLFYDYYLPVAKQSKASWNKDNQRFRDHIQPVLGYYRLSDITPSQVLTLQQNLMPSLAVATCNRVIVLVKALYTWAGRQGLTNVHPAKNIALLRENNARQRYFSEQEIRQIFRSAAEDNNQVAATYIRLLLLTGLRRDELRLARREHIDFVQRTLWLPVTKNGQGRIVHLNAPAMALLKILPAPGGNPWVFAGKEEGKPLANPVKAFHRIVKRAGIFDKDVCLHTCRHTVAALIVSHGGTLYDVQVQLGHRSSQSSQRYAHLHPQRLRHTSQLLAERIALPL